RRIQGGRGPAARKAARALRCAGVALERAPRAAGIDPLRRAAVAARADRAGGRSSDVVVSDARPRLHQLHRREVGERGGRLGRRRSSTGGGASRRDQVALRSRRAAAVMTAPERELIDDCLHCGFCLPHCPTYVSWGEEMDSPRGRIDLMRALRAGTTQMTPTVAGHFDKCLGCMACVTACPSGVRYDILIEETRALVEQKYRRGLYDRFHRAMIFALFPYPRRLKALTALLLVYTWSGLRWLLRHTLV